MTHSLRRTCAAFLLTLLLGAPALLAQASRGPVPARAGLSALTVSSEKPIPRMAFAGEDESRWLAGGTAGAVVGGLLGLILAMAVDRDDEMPSSGVTYVRAVVFSTAIGFSLGAIIGGQFKQ